jgi:hypothetical protein
MGMIKITMEDKMYQDLQTKLANLQIKEMQDSQWYPGEEKEIKLEISRRYFFLKNKMLLNSKDFDQAE